MLGSLGMKIYRYRNLVRRHWWILTLTISLGLAYEGYVIFSKKPLFQSQSQLLIAEELIRETIGQFNDPTGNFVNTQVDLLKGSIVTGRAAERLRLEAPQLAGSAEITAFVPTRTNIFIVTGTGTNPLYVQKFVDTTVDEFVKFRKENRGIKTSQVTGGLDESAEKLRQELAVNQAALQEFTKKNSIEFWTERRTKALAHLLGLQNQKTQLEDEAKRLQYLSPDEILLSASSPAVGKTPAAGDDKQDATFNSELYNEYSKLNHQLNLRKADYEKWKVVWKPAHPKLKAIVADMETIQVSINSVKQRNSQLVSNRKVSINAELKTLDASISQWEKTVLEASAIDTEYQALLAAKNRSETQLEKVLADIQALLVGKNTSTEPLQVVQKATIAQPVPPGTMKHLLIGFFGGLIVGSIILVVLDKSDDRLASSTEMIEHFSESILGQIPNVADTRGAAGLPLLQDEDERYTYAEAFRSLRSSLIFMPNQSELKTILITSAIPNEGKSTIASNLAITMAAAGARVLLVDADLRRGDLAQLFDVDGKAGLSNILRGETSWKSAVLDTKYPTLSLIPRGPVTNQSGELLLRPILVTLLEEFKAAYDLVIFNTAPILAADDTPTLAPNFDGTLMVVRAQFTSARLTKNSLNALYQRQVNVLGLILNAVDTETPDYYYYRYNQYYAA